MFIFIFFFKINKIMFKIYNCLDSEKMGSYGNHLHCYRDSKFSENEIWNFRNMPGFFVLDEYSNSLFHIFSMEFKMICFNLHNRFEKLSQLNLRSFLGKFGVRFDSAIFPFPSLLSVFFKIL